MIRAASGVIIVAAALAMGGVAYGRAAATRAAATRAAATRAAATRAAATRAASAPPGSDTAIIETLTGLHIAALQRTETGSYRPTGPARVLATLQQHKPHQTRAAAVLVTYPVGRLPAGCAGTGFDVFIATYQPHTTILGRTQKVGDWSVDADFPGYTCLSSSTPLMFTPYADSAGGLNPYRVDLVAVLAAPSVQATRFIGAGGRALSSVTMPRHFYFAFGRCDDVRAVQALDAGGRVLAERTLTAQDIAACRG